MIGNKTNLHWAWISGWGIPPSELAKTVQKHWPNDQHTVLAPTPTAVAEAKAINPDILAGYSLGSLLLLSETSTSLQSKTLHVAPILAFDLEEGLGGKTAARTRMILQKKFTQDSLAAVKLYLRLVGLNDLATENLPYAESDLLWGLEALGRLRANLDNISNTQFYTGGNDPLIDVDEIKKRNSHVHVIEGQGHDYRTLIPAISISGPK